MELDIVLGIDQTGAIDSRGKPKALPTCILEIKDGKAKFKKNQRGQIGFSLPSLEKDQYHKFLDDLGYSRTESKVFIAIDSVIGLPKKFYRGGKPKEKMLQYFKKAMNHQGYGLKAAESFFLKLLKEKSFSKGDFPKRKVEEALMANSVFRTRPFQKNIQTGSYRVWKDLSTYDQNEIIIWPFEELDFLKGLPVLAEAYPSLAWRELNKSSRQSSDFSYLYQKLSHIAGIKQIELSSPDHKDAALIALYSFYLFSKQPEYFLKTSTSIEGAIVGSSIF